MVHPLRAYIRNPLYWLLLSVPLAAILAVLDISLGTRIAPRAPSSSSPDCW